jgi:hypothetical protein
MILNSENTKSKTEFEVEKFKTEIFEIAVEFKAIENDLKHFLRICKKINAFPIEILMDQKKVLHFD